MPTSTSTKDPYAPERGAYGGGNGGDLGDDEGGGGGGGGKLVKVGFVRNSVEGEMLQGLLLESGIPSILKRSPGFDNPDFLAGGPHDIWVNSQNATEARAILEETLTESEGETEAEVLGRGGLGGDPMTPERLAIWLLAAVVAAAIIVFVLWELT